MKKSFLTFILISFVLVFGHAQQSPKREVRGAWIATYANIDWPKIRTEPVALQRAALISILDHHKATGINTIYFQIRSQCDAMYQSDIEPWSADLTGTQGKAPTELSIMDPSSTKVWDPLKFIIEACHERGMELHAWMNPYRAINNYNVINSFAPNHVARQHPEWLLSQGTLRILDPGIPAAQAYIRRVVGDVVSRYDLDGIHFDDYFYPPQAAAGVTPYNDDATFNADPRGFTDRGDWRRDNVNRFIHAVADTIMQLKPWVKFGVSPSGIYRNSTNPAIGSATSGLQHYVTLFADSRKWLQEGWIDYLAPQVYWYIGQPGANYAVIVPWWNNNAFGRHIYIGMAGYKVNDPLQGVNWANPSMIPNEIRLNRSALYPNVYGQAIYNTTSLLASKLGFRDSLRTNFFKHPALLPTMPWRDNVAPDPATALTGVNHDGDSVVLTWTAPTAVANEFDKIKRFVIYRSESPAIDFSNPQNIVTITASPVTEYIDRNLPEDTTYYYAVTSIDRFHNESVPSNVTDYTAPVITCIPSQHLELNVSCNVTLPDYTTLAKVSDDVSDSTAITITQSPVAGTVVTGSSITLVTLTATDASGKSSSCNFSVIAIDRLAPVITGTPQDVAVGTGEGSTSCSALINWTEPVALDNCTTPITFFRRSHEPGTEFPVGTTKVTYAFRDESGNADSTSFSVTVVDDSKPTVLVQNLTRSLVEGTVQINVEDIDSGTWDNCGISSLTISQSSFTCGDIGTHTVTLTAVDSNGNTNSATALVTIMGTVPQTSIQVSRDNTMFTGLPENTIAIGYGAQAFTFSAADANVTSGTEFEWSPTTGLSNADGSTTVFTPADEGSYTFAANSTNMFGCTSSTHITVHVIDVRCGNKADKVKLCSTVGNHSVESCVAPEAVSAMLKAHAKLGGCNNFEELPVETSVLSAYPNPFTNELNLQFKVPVSDPAVKLYAYDLLSGKTVHIFEGATEAGQVQNFIKNSSELPGRVFVVRLTTSTGKNYYLKVLRLNN